MDNKYRLSDEFLTAIKGVIPHYHKKRMEIIRKERGLTYVQLIMIALDNELMEETPFTFDAEIPRDEYTQGTYTHEAGKIMDFLGRVRNGQFLNWLLFFRFQIGVPDKAIFLAALRECINERFVIPVVAPQTDKSAHHEGTLKYQLADDAHSPAQRANLKEKKLRLIAKLQAEANAL